MKGDYNADVTANSVQTHHMGFVQLHEFGGTAFVEKIVAEQTNRQDAQFNVNIDGSALFSSTQSVASSDTPETLVPDQNRHAAGENVRLEVDVTASASFADQLRVGVLINDGREYKER